MIPAPAKTLVDAVYGPRWGDAYLEWGVFDAAGFHRIGSGRASAVTPPDDQAVFWSAGLLKPGGDRSNANVEKLMVFLIDDVGGAPNSRFDPGELELFMPEPTSVIESSPGNHQWQWGITDGMDEDVVTALRRSLPWQSHATAMSNLIRLPMGVNGKPGVTHVVQEVKRGPTYTAAEFIQRCGGLRVPVQPKKQVVAGLKAPSEGAVIEILKLLPNDGVSPYCDSEPAWFNFCQALYGATGGEGLGLWQGWCAAQPQERDVTNVWHRQDPVSSGWDTLVMYADKWGKGSRGALAGIVFDDGALPPEPEEEPTHPKASRKGLVFVDPTRAPATLARREWLYGKRLIRGYLSSTIAAGGTGKSSLEMAEAVAMTTGIDILKEGADRMAPEPLRVWMWNGEDPQMELDLRFFAIMKHYGIVASAFGTDRMGIMSGRDNAIAVAGPAKRGFGVDRDCIGWVREIITTNKIDVVMIDPLVSSHRVPENDNMAIDLVAKAWSRIAEECGCAVSLAHHIRKPGNGMTMDLTVDDARGASALINASRNARVLSPMGKEAADGWGIPNRKAYFSIQHDATKANMIPAGVGADWYHFVSVDVGNGDVFALPKIDGDQVGVVEKWMPPAAMSMDDPAVVNKALDEVAKGRFRADEKSPAWIGNVIKEGSKKQKRDIINGWIDKGWLKKEIQKDETRHDREFIVVGNRPEEGLF